MHVAREFFARSAVEAFRNAACRLKRADSGTGALEFAFVAPLLIILLLGVADFGIGYWDDMEVGNAARAGAEYAIKKGWDTTSIQNAITNATGLSGITATPAPAQTCGCPSATQGVVAQTCGVTCSSGSTPGTYVTASAQYSYRTLVPWPWISNPVTLSASTTVRIN